MMTGVPHPGVFSLRPPCAGLSIQVCDSEAWAGQVDPSHWPLYEDDHQRAARLRDTASGSRLLVSLASARVMLGTMLDVSPHEVALGRHPEGAPFLRDWPERNVSISRSEGWTAVALSDGCRVGIDIELVRPLGWKPMLSMICGPAEQASFLELSGQQPDAALSRFFRMWTVKEAVLKATGRGFRAGAPSIVVPETLLTGPAATRYTLPVQGREYGVWTEESGDLVSSGAVESQP